MTWLFSNALTDVLAKYGIYVVGSDLPQVEQLTAFDEV